MARSVKNSGEDESETSKSKGAHREGIEENNWIDSSRHTGLVLIQNSYIDQIHTIKEK
jgi:hypothetical protein